MRTSFKFLIGFAVLGASLLAGERLTYVDLVKHLTDLERVAILPAPGEKCAQASSYDRASKYDEATGKYVRWDANGDGGGIIRKEGDISVLAEIEGPGCIRRTWSATAGKGHVKIYLDGATEPAVDLAFDDYFSRKAEPFTFPALVYKTAANGFDNYVPIPFQKSCKILGDKGWGNYYHFTYTTFPKDTIVPTFSMKLSPEDLAALQAADAAFSKGLGSDPAGVRAEQGTVNTSVSVAPGQSVQLAKINGARAITALNVKMDPATLGDAETTLRAMTLSIRWDGETTPSVWTPLGDFFGTAPGINKYSSVPLGMTDNGCYSYWYMPFASEALIEVKNDGATAVKLDANIVHAPLTKPIDSLARFHAKWHRDALLPAEPERAIDWTMLKTTGRGRFCGVMLHVWNPCGDWWGEGDEKFFVDGEKFPSTFGTGSEDYFGYAWSSGKIFFQALHNQPNNHGDNVGHLSVNRWHIADNVPFQTSFEGAIEKYFPNKRPTQYACVVYWYQAPGGKDPYEPLPVAERVGYCVKPYFVEGAIEGERLRVSSKTGGNAGGQNMSGFTGQWSFGNQLFWTEGKAGDKLTLNVPVKVAGKCDISAQFTKARDYGIVQAYWDDEKLGEPTDLYNAEVIPSGALKLGTRDVTAGTHKLILEITGKNENASKTNVGLDYILVTPQK
ncbi:MAG TPA: glycoside hydrolase family 172 protein [Planctomycetota bacterium]